MAKRSIPSVPSNAAPAATASLNAMSLPSVDQIRAHIMQTFGDQSALSPAEFDALAQRFHGNGDSVRMVKNLCQNVVSMVADAAAEARRAGLVAPLRPVHFSDFGVASPDESVASAGSAQGNAEAAAMVPATTEVAIATLVPAVFSLVLEVIDATQETSTDQVTTMMTAITTAKMAMERLLFIASNVCSSAPEEAVFFALVAMSSLVKMAACTAPTAGAVAMAAAMDVAAARADIPVGVKGTI